MKGLMVASGMKKFKRMNPIATHETEPITLFAEPCDINFFVDGKVRDAITVTVTWIPVCSGVMEVSSPGQNGPIMHPLQPHWFNIS